MITVKVVIRGRRKIFFVCVFARVTSEEGDYGGYFVINR